MIIDCHLHAFPDFLAPRTMQKLSQVAQIKNATDGTYADTLRLMEESEVSGGIFLHIASNPTQQKNVNNWAAQIQTDRFLCFGSVHPDAEDAIQELSRIKTLGLRGVKLHPDYQNFFADEEKLRSIYETLCELELPVWFHAGYDPYSPRIIHAGPSRLAKVHEMFPRLVMVCAHMGGYDCYEETLTALAGQNSGEEIYFDTSMAPDFLNVSNFESICRRHGTDRILFGSDCPWGTPRRTMEFIERTNLSDDEKEKIFFGNAERLFLGKPRMN